MDEYEDMPIYEWLKKHKLPKGAENAILRSQESVFPKNRIFTLGDLRHKVYTQLHIAGLGKTNLRHVNKALFECAPKSGIKTAVDASFFGGDLMWL